MYPSQNIGLDNLSKKGEKDHFKYHKLFRFNFKCLFEYFQ